MPSVTFDSMDVSNLLKNIKRTQDEVDMLKVCISTQNDAFDGLRTVVSAVETRVSDPESRIEQTSTKEPTTLTTEWEQTSPRPSMLCPPEQLLSREAAEGLWSPDCDPTDLKTSSALDLLSLIVILQCSCRTTYGVKVSVRWWRTPKPAETRGLAVLPAAGQKGD